MKYEYQDIIIKELLKQKGNEIDKKSLKNASLNVFHYEFGNYEPNPEYKSPKFNPNIHITIAKGCILNVCDLQGSDYSIDFTIYEMNYPVGYDNHTLCVLNII